jgi:hypothetical protein
MVPRLAGMSSELSGGLLLPFDWRKRTFTTPTGSRLFAIFETAQPVRGSLANTALAAARRSERFRTTGGISRSFGIPSVRAIIHASTVPRS